MSEVVFEAKPKQLKLVIADKNYMGRFPFYGEVKAFTEELQKFDGTKDEMGAAKVMDEFLAKLGFPQEAIDNLDVDNFKNFLTTLVSSKKN